MTIAARSQRNRASPPLFPSLLAATWLSWCGGCAGIRAHEPEQPSAAVVKMHLHSFEPESVTIRTGEAVLWKNTSFIWHTVTADPEQAKRPEDVTLPPGGQSFDSGKVQAGQQPISNLFPQGPDVHEHVRVRQHAFVSQRLELVLGH